jgi:hypothetical protein
MPSSTMGFGTKFFGATDRHEDGSFVTTEWVIVFSVPVVPLRSLRVSVAGYQEDGFVGMEVSTYNVHGDVPLSLRQVLGAYAWLVIPALLATVIAVGIATDSSGKEAATFLTVALTVGIGFWVLVFPSKHKAE